jgi:hypothetical protein
MSSDPDRAVPSGRRFAVPFHWPPPLERLLEECTEGSGLFADKSLGLAKRKPSRTVE